MSGPYKPRCGYDTSRCAHPECGCNVRVVQPYVCWKCYMPCPEHPSHLCVTCQKKVLKPRTERRYFVRITFKTGGVYRHKPTGERIYPSAVYPLTFKTEKLAWDFFHQVYDERPFLGITLPPGCTRIRSASVGSKMFPVRPRPQDILHFDPKVMS